ncbi:hypothetical protein C8R44DRAFT_765919 [Mycena epipterygia]|nr:hypothetical protein C8R44DRAFT_765919 [Mycena epipterygia]
MKRVRADELERDSKRSKLVDQGFAFEFQPTEGQEPGRKENRPLNVPLNDNTNRASTSGKEKQKANTGLSFVLTASRTTAPSVYPVPVLPTVSPVAAPVPHAQPSPYLDPTTEAESRYVALNPRPEVPWGFTPLSEVAAEETKWALRSVIGIVASITPASRSSGWNGDWTRSLRIVDPSNWIESYPPPNPGFRVNCFTKKYERWLPAAKVGDIVILDSIKTTGGGSANGYHDRMKWAVYDSSQGKVWHGDLTGVPQSERLADGSGAPFTPFYQATHAELAYCQQLDAWRRTAEMGTVHRIGGGDSSRPKRAHMVASDFSESETTAEYFDCTVEVLHGYQNDNNTFILYVTDYTSLLGSRACPWQNGCSHCLAKPSIRIKMWDAASGRGPQMAMDTGGFYALRNVRMVNDRDGFREAKLVENKIHKLDPSAAHSNAEFKALLERRQAFGSVDDSSLELMPASIPQEVGSSAYPAPAPPQNPVTHASLDAARSHYKSKTGHAPPPGFDEGFEYGRRMHGF